MYDFSVALISALAFLKYTNLRLTMVALKKIGDLPMVQLFTECVLCHYILLFYTRFCRRGLQTIDNGLVSATSSAQA